MRKIILPSVLFQLIFAFFNNWNFAIGQNIKGDMVIMKEKINCCNYINFDGSYAAYIDASLNCLNLNSFSVIGEKFNRIWRVNQNFTDTNYLEVILLEFGEKLIDSDIKYSAKLFQIKWHKPYRRKIELKAINVTNFAAKVETQNVLKAISNKCVDELLVTSFPSQLPLSMGHNMLFFQHFNGENVQTIDFCNRPNFSEPISKRDNLFYDFMIGVSEYLGIDILEKLRIY